MATHPTRPRGVTRKAKRPSTSPFDRGRVTALEDAVEQLKEADAGGS